MNTKPSNTEDQNLISADVPEDVVNRIASYGKGASLWGRLCEEGFRLNDKIHPELRGYITRMRDKLVKFENSKPIEMEIPDNGDIPPGYRIRVDLNLLVEDQAIGLSLPESSVKYRLSPYIEALRDAGLKPSAVMTRLWVETVQGKRGKFLVVCFELSEDPLHGSPTSTEGTSQSQGRTHPSNNTSEPNSASDDAN